MQLIPNAGKVAKKSHVVRWLILAFIFSALETGLQMMSFPDWISPNLVSIFVMFCIIMAGISRFMYQKELHVNDNET